MRWRRASSGILPARATELGDRWIAELDRHHVQRAALIASIPGDAASVAEAVAHHPDRFVGFFMHNPAQPSAETVLERALRDLSIRGICLFPAMHGYRMDEMRVDVCFAPRRSTRRSCSCIAAC